MVSAMKVHLTDKQRKTLLRRAGIKGTTLSAEARKAIDLYLDFPPDFEDKCLAALTKEANASLIRNTAKLNAAARSKRAMERIEEIEPR